ncbi:hypothetical protein KR074_000612 [Drosophila pseudoananassae]|nr:hypothetical protein KR074_000612 [Drosophila pseudoananassae]
MQCSQRLTELFEEIQSVKQVVNQEGLKLSRIQPEIQTNNETMKSLKQKRRKVHTAAMDLGRGIMGDDYSLLDEVKTTIIQKCTQLTKDIRLYNSMVVYDDLKDLQPKSLIEQEDTAPTPLAQDPPRSASRYRMPLDNPAQREPSEASQAVTQPRLFFVIKMRGLTEERAKRVGSLWSKYLLPYQTPVSRNYNSDLDVYAILCPFELMGLCEDEECTYLHLPRPEGQPARLSFLRPKKPHITTKSKHNPK